MRTTGTLRQRWLRTRGWYLITAMLVFSSLFWTQGLAADEITNDLLDAFIDHATSYLVRTSHTKEQDPHHPGAFTYQAYLGEELQLHGFDEHPKRNYNLLRHNGAIYALALAYERKQSEHVKEAMLRGIEYLKGEVGPVPDLNGSVVPNLLAPWELVTFGDTRPNPHKRAKLGGAGLGLIALCNVERLVPGTTDLDYMRQIGNFIQHLQGHNGAFASRYSSKTGKDKSWTSLYYPGEAALGLVYLYEIETDEDYKRKWLSVATDTLLYLERLRRNQPVQRVEADHWALLASARLLPKLEKNSVEYWLVYNHAIKVIHSMLVEVTDKELKDHNGCFTKDKRTCPTATRLEGLINSLSFVKDYEVFIDEDTHIVLPLREKMRHHIELGIGFLLQSQQQTHHNNMKGAVPAVYPAETEDDGEVRVDYVQHSMSAVIAYEEQIAHHHPPSRILSTILEAEGLDVALLAVALFFVASLVLLVLPFTGKRKSLRYNE